MATRSRSDQLKKSSGTDVGDGAKPTIVTLHLEHVKLGSVLMECTSSTQVPTHFRYVHKSYPKLLLSGFRLLPQVWCTSGPMRASGAYVSCDDLQKPYVSHIGPFACPGIALSSLSQCSVSGPALGDGVVVCQFILRACHFVLTLWLCLQICLAARGWNSAHCSSADLRRLSVVADTFEEVLRNPKTTTRERRSFRHVKNTSTLISSLDHGQQCIPRPRKQYTF